MSYQKRSSLYHVRSGFFIPYPKSRFFISFSNSIPGIKKWPKSRPFTTHYFMFVLHLRTSISNENLLGSLELGVFNGAPRTFFKK